MLQYVPRATITPSVKMGYKNVCFSGSAQSNYSHSVDQVDAQTFKPKQIMTSLEHHVLMSQQHRGFQLMTFMSALKG